MLPLALSCRPCGNESHVVASVCVHHDEDATDRVEADRDESLFELGGVVNGDGLWIEQHALGIGETDAVLAQVGLTFGRVPNGLHVCIICI